MGRGPVSTPKASMDWQPGEEPRWLARSGVWDMAPKSPIGGPLGAGAQAEFAASHSAGQCRLTGYGPTLGGEGQGFSPLFRGEEGQFQQKTQPGQERGQGGLVGGCGHPSPWSWPGCVDWRVETGVGAGPRPIRPFPAIPQRGWSRARLGPEPPLRALLHPAQGLALNKYVLTKTVIA